MEKVNETKSIKKFRTYVANNFVVIKDNALYKVLIKLLSLQMKEVNKATKNNQATDNITLQYSLNEFRLDLQMGKATILKKIDILNSVGLLSIEKCKDEKNAYCKNTYQLNINKLEEIEDNLNKMRRLERVEYINSFFKTTTSKGLQKIKEDKLIDDDVDSLVDVPTEDDFREAEEEQREVVRVELSKQSITQNILPLELKSKKLKELAERYLSENYTINKLFELKFQINTLGGKWTEERRKLNNWVNAEIKVADGYAEEITSIKDNLKSDGLGDEQIQDYLYQAGLIDLTESAEGIINLQSSIMKKTHYHLMRMVI